MLGILIFILIVWAALAVAGFLIKGLFWLAVIGLILFVITILFGAIKGAFKRSS